PGARAEGGVYPWPPAKIHEQRLPLMNRNARHGGTAGNGGEQVVPAAAHAPRMALEQLAQRDPHRVLYGAGPLHVAGNAEQFRAGIVGPPDAREPVGAAPQDVGHHGDRFDVIDGGRTAVSTDIGREWWL